MRLIIAAVLLALLPLPARAQSLAEIAAKEKERRAAAKAAKKSYTDKDLPNSGFSPIGDAATPSPEPGASPAPKDSKPEKSDAEVRAERKADLQKRLDEELKVKAAVRKAMDDAQRELDDVSNYKFGTRREALMKIVEDGQKEQAKIDQTIADLDEQARREGITLSR